MRVSQLRKELHQQVKDGLVIDVADVEIVNTFSRTDVMKENTRDLTKILSAFVSKEDYGIFIKHLQEFEHLAVDWISSGNLEWQESLAAKKMAQIMYLLREKQQKDLE